MTNCKFCDSELKDGQERWDQDGLGPFCIGCWEK
jgi:hypothetical protein